MEATTTPTLEESLAKFAARVAEGKATSDELAFMTKVAGLAASFRLTIDAGELVQNIDREFASMAPKGR